MENDGNVGMGVFFWKQRFLVCMLILLGWNAIRDSWVRSSGVKTRATLPDYLLFIICT